MPVSLKDAAAQAGIQPTQSNGKISLHQIAGNLGIQPVAKNDQSRLQETVGDVVDFGKNLFGRYQERSQDIIKTGSQVYRGEITPIEGSIRYLGEAAGAVGDLIGEGFVGLGKLLTSQETENEIKTKFQGFLDKTGASKALTNGYEWWQGYKASNPRTAELIEAAANVADAFLELSGTGYATKATRQTAENLVDATGRRLRVTKDALIEQKDKLFGKQVDGIKSNNDLIKKSDELLQQTPDTSGVAQQVRTMAEESAPKLSIKEKWAGIRPDIKKRIAGKQDQLKTYFDIAHASNLDDMLPTVYDYANLKVKRAGNLIKNQLDDVGSRIGKTRRKLATVRVPLDKVNEVIKQFDSELDRLNLGINNRGDIIQQTGRAQAVGAGEMRVLQTLRDNLKVIKQNPTVENIIDNRTIFDDRINFAKRSADVSGVVDPLSRKIRRSLADINAETVGKTNAKDLEAYSLAKDAEKMLEGYTKRKAGTEFLLRLVLSGRGREARDVIRLIKDLTGIDLMDDAVMLQIAVELIGNDRTKNLFRQEIGKAGLDVAKILGNGKRGALEFLFEKGVNKFLDVEEQFLNAAK